MEKQVGELRSQALEAIEGVRSRMVKFNDAARGLRDRIKVLEEQLSASVAEKQGLQAELSQQRTELDVLRGEKAGLESRLQEALSHAHGQACQSALKWQGELTDRNRELQEQNAELYGRLLAVAAERDESAERLGQFVEEIEGVFQEEYK
jgi:chromosome segregation ATPase